MIFKRFEFDIHDYYFFAGKKKTLDY